MLDLKLGSMPRPILKNVTSRHSRLLVWIQMNPFAGPQHRKTRIKVALNLGGAVSKPYMKISKLCLAEV
jgi:hypothetical protein